MISDSVKLWDTDVCFLNIQLMGANVLLPKIQKTPPEVDFESSKSPTKSDNDVESWTESEGASSSEQCEYNMESSSLRVMVQDQSGEKVCLFLEDWELARVALSGHITLDMLCQEMHEAW